MITTSTASTLNSRDRAVLRAVAAGRAELAGASGRTLVIDGLCFADQFAGSRLTAAGLIAAGIGRARLTASGHALLAATTAAVPAAA